MGGAPVIVTIAPGIQFEPGAAASFLRLVARLGRTPDVNSTYRDYDTQERMYLAWEAWVAGTGPKPAHSRAIAPWLSKHCMGLAWDTDDWTKPGFIALAAEYGWVRTAPTDLTERHHFEYQWWADKHRDEPAPAGMEEDDMFTDADRDRLATIEAMLYAGGKSASSTSYLGAEGTIYRMLAQPVERAVDGVVKRIPQIQDNADTNTLVRLLVARQGGVDEEALAQSLAPLLTANLGALSDDDVKRIAIAAADEQAKRLAS